MHVMACVITSINFSGSICILAAFKFFISFFLLLYHLSLGLDLLFFLTSVDLVSSLHWLVSFIKMIFMTLVDTVVLTALFDLVPEINIHSAWNFVNAISDGATFNKLWAIAVKYWSYSQWVNWVISTSFACDFQSGQMLITFLARTCNSSVN